MSRSLPSQELRLGKYALRVNVRLESWAQARVGERLLAKDPSLWQSGSAEEVSSRLGWLDLPDDGMLLVPQLEEFAQQVRREGIKRVFLIGMGGSSLAPEVFESTFGDAENPFVCVADSTHPDAVRSWIDEIDSDKYFFIVSSKSGSTLETRSLHSALWHAMERWHSQAGLRFAAITDPDSSLELAANLAGFSRVFSTPKNVGGRFSALSAFGLAPAVLSGVDAIRLLESAGSMLESCSHADSPALELGAALGELALAGRDKLTLVASPAVASFPNWIEQLVAESLGKSGRGIVPIVDEPPAAPELYGDDRVFVGILLEGDDGEEEEHLRSLARSGHPVILIRLGDRYDLGAEIIRWEVAVATAALVLRVQPFDQPDVESTKVLTRKAMEEGGADIGETAPVVFLGDAAEISGALASWKESIRAGDYIALQAFLAPDPRLDAELRSLQETLRNATGCAVSRGYGPRYLHSTGQLHKGGANTGVFLQLCDRPRSDLIVFGESYSFATVIGAQADGDAAALRQGKRRVLRVRLEGDAEADVARLRGLLA